MHEAVFNSRQPIQTYSLSYAKMGLFLCNYRINIYNICQPFVMWYLSNEVLCSHHMTRSTVVHIRNTHNDACCIQFCIHSGLHQVDNLVHCCCRILIAITITLPFLMCHRKASCTQPKDTFWWNSCRWSVPNESLSTIESNGRLLLDFAISFWLVPSDKRMDAYLRKKWQDFSFMLSAKVFTCVYHKTI